MAAARIREKFEEFENVVKRAPAIPPTAMP